MDYVAPAVSLDAFNCPHCRAFAMQQWCEVRLDNRPDTSPLPVVVDKLLDDSFVGLIALSGDPKIKSDIENNKKLAGGAVFRSKMGSGLSLFNKLQNMFVGECAKCKGINVWAHTRMIYPDVGFAVPANPDMPEEIRRDFEEASSVLQKSPRSAAALLRLCIQKLCKELGQKGSNINEDIQGLVDGGMGEDAQKAFDIVRIVGNSAVHPGQIDVRDDQEMAGALFKLVNYIVEKMISNKKQVAELYNSMPSNLLQGIENRGKRK